MSDQQTKCYAVMDDDSMDADVVAIYARREDAEARVARNNDQPIFFLDGQPATSAQVNDARAAAKSGDDYDSITWWSQHVKRNDEREQYDDMHVEEFEFFGPSS